MTTKRKSLPGALRPAALACAALLAALPAWALYKVVGPDGKVTYTDRPPTSDAGKAVPLTGNANGAPAAASLPYALRNAVSRFPVVLYTVSDCDSCDRGRDLLRSRGVPFQERIASSDADKAAWQSKLSSSQAPVLSVGGQMLRGLSVDQWNAYLDVAGYPRESQLPANYSAPPPQPLIDRPAPVPVPEPEPAPAAATAPPPPASGGFRF